MNRSANKVKRCALCTLTADEEAFVVDGFVRDVCAFCRKEAERKVKQRMARWGVPKTEAKK